LISSAAQTSAPCELGGELTLCCCGSADGFAPIPVVGLIARRWPRSATKKFADVLNH
jgi:hypothetical protein